MSGYYRYTTRNADLNYLMSGWFSVKRVRLPCGRLQVRTPTGLYQRSL